MKNMADLDPAEEKLLAEALFDTANDDYFEQDVELEAVEGDGEPRHVPNSKIQFPIRRRRSTFYRKLICFGILLALLGATVVGVYFLLKSRTVSLELKLTPGQTLRYKLEQESMYEGVRQTRSSFSEEVFVHVVNKTGNQYWLKVQINSLPSSKKQKFSFLVRVDLDKQNTKDFGQEERFRVFTSRTAERSREMDFYVYNFLFQLLPVVKIDLFEILLSQITTRKHEVTVQDSVLFPGIATMEQHIRSSDDQILITSQIKPEGFNALATKTTSGLPGIEMTFEEDASITKSSGMLKKSDVELATKIPIGEHLNSNPDISMKFKSSLRFVEDVSSKKPKENTKENENFVQLSRPSSKGTPARLRYFFPTKKNYDEKANVVDKVKGMLRLTSSQDAPRNKDIVEFSKSFHKIVKPGEEVNFAAAEKRTKVEKPVSGDERWGHGNVMGKGESRARWHEHDRHQSNDDDGIEDDDEDSDDDNERWNSNNRSGLAVPMYPEDRDPHDDNDDERDREPEDDEEDVDDDDDDDQPAQTDSKDVEIDEPKNKARPTKSARKDDIPTGYRNTESRKPMLGTQKDSDDGKNSDDGKDSDNGNNSDDGKDKLKPTSGREHSSSEERSEKKMDEPRTQEGNVREDKRLLHQVGTKSTDKVKENNTVRNVTPTVATPPTHEHNFFSSIFDRLWNDDDDDDKEDDNGHEFKFPPPLPFSFSSDFPFLHFRWPGFEDRKRRSLETTPQSRKPRDTTHRDKRRLFGRGAGGGTKHPHYTGEDLEAVWDVISYAKSNARPRKTTAIFQQRIFGLDVKGVLEHEVQVLPLRGDMTEWVIRLDLLLNVGEHRFQVLSKTYTMKEIDETFIKQSKPKLEYGTVHAGTLALCTPLFYIENICIEIQLGFVIHVSHAIEHITKEFPVDLSIFFKHLTRVDAVLSSHMDTLLGSSGVYSHGAIFGAKIPLEVKFSEERSAGKWCSVANVKSKIGHFYENRDKLSQWKCQFDESKNSRSNCTGLDENKVPEAERLWYMDGQSKKLHFLNTC